MFAKEPLFKRGCGRGPLYEVPVSHSSSKVGIHPPPVAKTRGHTYNALGASSRDEWQWSTIQPRPDPDQLINSYSNVMASSMDGMCEKAIMSSEFQSSVLIIGWLCKISNRACWKQGHSLSKWSKVSGSSSQNLHSSETSSGYILLCK